MDETKTWHLEKSVSVSHILTTVVMVVALFSAIITIERRITIMEANYDNLNNRVMGLLERQAHTDQAQDISLQTFRAEMRDDVNTINDKLDRLIERQP